MRLTKTNLLNNLSVTRNSNYHHRDYESVKNSTRNHYATIDNNYTENGRSIKYLSQRGEGRNSNYNNMSSNTI